MSDFNLNQFVLTWTLDFGLGLWTLELDFGLGLGLRLWQLRYHLSCSFDNSLTEEKLDFGSVNVYVKHYCWRKITWEFTNEYLLFEFSIFAGFSPLSMFARYVEWIINVQFSCIFLHSSILTGGRTRVGLDFATIQNIILKLNF